MTVTDPIERAARIIAAHVEPVWSWDELTDKWKTDYRLAAEAVLNDFAARTPAEDET